MSELTLEHVSAGAYVLGEIGTLQELRWYGSEIQADGTTWTVRRAGRGFGPRIHAFENAAGDPVSSYVPRRYLLGIRAGTITRAERTLDWRSKRLLGSIFTLTENGAELAHFTGGTPARPVSLSIDDPNHVEALLLLFCCHLVKQVVEVAKLSV